MPFSRTLNILVVEDEPEARANLRDILELEGHNIDEAGTASEALADRDWKALDAVILDRQLPDATAEQLMPKLRRMAPDAAILLVTGHGDIQGAISALRHGANDYILKPLNVDALSASLARLAERSRLAREKARSEANFRDLVEAADCLIMILRPDRTAAYVSPFSERITGYPAEVFHSTDFFELLMPEPERQAAVDEFGRLLRGGSQTHGYEASIRCRDGTPRGIVWNARLLPDYDGGPAVLAVGQDITSLKQAQERAVQSERLAAIGQMVAGLAHESRNTLQRSQACIEMLRFEIEDRPRALDLVNRLQAAQDHLHCLYEDVRGYAAPIHLDLRPIRLDEAWREAWNHAAHTCGGKQATLREHVVDDLNLVVVADRFRLGQVFRNIFENAVAAFEPPVEIDVAVENASIDGHSALVIHVRDCGPGILPEICSTVFEPFVTTKTKGTGLGLSIARRIIEAHGGRIALGEPTAPGAEFVITLPRE